MSVVIYQHFEGGDPALVACHLSTLAEWKLDSSIIPAILFCLVNAISRPSGNSYTGQAEIDQGLSGLVPNCVILTRKGINLGLFKISFSTFWLDEPKCTETYLKKSQIYPICGNLIEFGCQL